MKLKKYISQILWAACGVMLFGACEDMLDSDSVYVLNAEDSHLVNPSDTANSLVGIIFKLQGIADRTNVLGEVRGDLVSVRPSAHADLQALANFGDTKNNKYNAPKDYYAVINNCNYYLAYADAGAMDIAGKPVFEKEMAQVRAIRAWTYLQLALNYGKVPFYTNPVITSQDAEAALHGERKDLRQICDYFIEDLKPYTMVEFPTLHKVGSITMFNCMFPIPVVLGDLYLWKASLNNDKGAYREAARCYYQWIAAQRAGKSVYPLGYTTAYWSKTNSSATGVWNFGVSWSGYDVYNGAESSDIVTFIPMDSLSYQGYYSEVRNLYNSVPMAGASENSTNYDPNQPYSLVPSQRMIDLSKAQTSYALDSNGDPITIVYNEEQIRNNMDGDYRLNRIWRTGSQNNSQGGLASQFTWQQITKNNTRHVKVYRKTDIWLRLAEALNNGGFPRMAYAILATGFNDKVVEDSVLSYCNEADRNFLENMMRTYNTGNFSLSNFSCRNGIKSVDKTIYHCCGIHSRGCGYAEVDPGYAYPMPDTTGIWQQEGGYDKVAWAYQHMTEEQQKVDKMIFDETALEQAFEGQRYYIMMRYAKRYGDNEKWLADPVSKRAGEASADGSIYSKLMTESNWYLQLPE